MSGGQNNLKSHKMDNTSIAQLQKQPVFIFSDITELFEVYSKDIRPRIKETGSLSIHQKASIAKPTLYSQFFINKIQSF